MNSVFRKTAATPTYYGRSSGDAAATRIQTIFEQANLALSPLARVATIINSLFKLRRAIGLRPLRQGFVGQKDPLGCDDWLKRPTNASQVRFHPTTPRHPRSSKPFGHSSTPVKVTPPSRDLDTRSPQLI
ncbi:hypothetical protein BKA70DRAFT_1561888 [Coprinopsis sp. MPI-PUGE-AT-0042]|nr:hypothetical protein BKA70DRAFT_1561888 [Coprinopsis sp. MPI-PUGE-AT-0042]